jgi:hypothetical protein
MSIDTIETRRIGTVDGFDIDAVLTFDEDTRPFDFDCYDEETIAAWRADEWHYVGTIVTASRAGIELGSASLWSSEYGSLPGVHGWVSPLDGDGDEFVNGYGPDLIAEAIAEAQTTLAELNDSHV